MKSLHDTLVELALRTLPENADLAAIGGPSVPTPKLAARRVISVREDEALAFLHARGHAPLDGVLAARPTSFAPLIPFLAAARGALREKGRALIADLVWQTAPTPELLRAFAPPPSEARLGADARPVAGDARPAPPAGREKVRPVEGYEMQIEHAGFEILERAEVERARWAPQLASDARAAVEADTRGAARVVAWVLAPKDDDG